MGILTKIINCSKMETRRIIKRDPNDEMEVLIIVKETKINKSLDGSSITWASRRKEKWKIRIKRNRKSSLQENNLKKIRKHQVGQIIVWRNWQRTIPLEARPWEDRKAWICHMIIHKNIILLNSSSFSLFFPYHFCNFLHRIS